MSRLTRGMVDDMLPKGPIWTPAEEGHFDSLLEGIADNWDEMREFLSMLSDIRNPYKTVILEDLEREYGIIPDTRLTEAERRQRLAALVYENNGGGTIDALQGVLDRAGFNVQVHANDPAVDPAIFLTQAFQMVAGGDNAYAGRPDAFAGITGGELLVNGDAYKTSRIFTSVAGNVYAGDGTTAGEYDTVSTEKIVYKIPTDPNDWPLVFFVGGDATRDISGALTDIALADVPIERKNEFKRIILRYKPMHTWAGLIIDYN